MEQLEMPFSHMTASSVIYEIMNLERISEYCACDKCSKKLKIEF